MKLNYLLPEKEATENCHGFQEAKFVNLLMALLGLNFFVKDVEGDTGIFLHRKNIKLIKTF